MSDVIQQGTDCVIEASNITDKRSGQPMDVTGYEVRAAARAHRSGPVIAEWSTTPSGTQGTAIASGDLVQLLITPEQTSPWTTSCVRIQAEIVDPVTGNVARVIDEVYQVSFEVVT